MKTYTIIAGVNGVGKSSFTGMLKERLELGTIVDVDQITAAMGQGRISGGKEALNQISSCIQKGVSFAQESTLSGHSIKMQVKKAKELGYKIRLFYIGLNSAEESIVRIKNRVIKGGHHIPSEDVLRRFDSRWKALEKLLPFCDEAEFYDNDNGFMKVASYQERVFQVEGNSNPQWLSELTNYLQDNPEIQVRFPSFKNRVQNAARRAGTVQPDTKSKETKYEH